MRTLIQYRTFWITALAWMFAVALAQITRGDPLVPSSSTLTGFWSIQLVIGLLLGGCAHVIARIVAVIRGVRR